MPLEWNSFISRGFTIKILPPEAYQSNRKMRNLKLNGNLPSYNPMKLNFSCGRRYLCVLNKHIWKCSNPQMLWSRLPTKSYFNNPKKQLLCHSIEFYHWMVLSHSKDGLRKPEAKDTSVGMTFVYRIHPHRPSRCNSHFSRDQLCCVCLSESEGNLCFTKS